MIYKPFLFKDIKKNLWKLGNGKGQGNDQKKDIPDFSEPQTSKNRLILGATFISRKMQYGCVCVCVCVWKAVQSHHNK